MNEAPKGSLQDLCAHPLRSLDLRSQEAAQQVRQTVLEHLHRAGGGHFGSCASCIEILLALCASRPLNCLRQVGDKLLLSKGHASMALYAVLSLIGPDPLPLEEFGTFGSPLQGHPDRKRFGAVDFSFGSLGQGVAVGLGLALGLQTEGHHVWVVVGDGECQEGMVWEAAMLAARYRVGNLQVIVDANGEQECGWGHDLTLDQRPLPDDLSKWSAFGWQTDEADGHDVGAISRWIGSRISSSVAKPSVLIARTRKSLAECVSLPRFRNHHSALTPAEFRAISGELVKSGQVRDIRLDTDFCVPADDDAVGN